MSLQEPLAPPTSVSPAPAAVPITDHHAYKLVDPTHSPNLGSHTITAVGTTNHDGSLAIIYTIGTDKSKLYKLSLIGADSTIIGKTSSQDLLNNVVTVALKIIGKGIEQHIKTDPEKLKNINATSFNSTHVSLNASGSQRHLEHVTAETSVLYNQFIMLVRGITPPAAESSAPSPRAHGATPRSPARGVGGSGVSRATPQPSQRPIPGHPKASDGEWDIDQPEDYGDEYSEGSEIGDDDEIVDHDSGIVRQSPDKQIKDLKFKLDNSVAQFGQLEDENKELQEEYEDKDRENYSLKGELTQAQGSIGQLSRELEDERARGTHTQSTFTSELARVNAEHKSTVADLRTQLGTATTHKDQAIASANAAEATIRELRAQLADGARAAFDKTLGHETAVGALRTELQAANAARDGALAEFSTLTTQHLEDLKTLEGLRGELTNANGQLVDVRREAARSRELSGVAESEFGSALTDANQKLGRSSTRLSELESQLAISTTRATDLERQLAGATQSHEALTSTHADFESRAESEIAAMKERLASEGSRAEKAEEEVTRLTEALALTKKVLTPTENAIAGGEIEEDRELLESQLRDAQEETKAAREQIMRLSTDLSEITEAFEDRANKLSDLEEDLRGEQSELKQTKTQLAAANAKASSAEEQFEHVKGQLISTEEINRDLRSQLDNSQKDKAFAQRKAGGLEALQSQLNEVLGSKTQLHRKLDTSESDAAAAQRKFADMEANQSVKVSRLESQLGDLQKELELARSEKGTGKEIAPDTEKLESRISALEEELNAAKSAKSISAQSATTALQEVGALKTQLLGAQVDKKTAEHELKAAKQSQAGQVGELDQQVADLNAELTKVRDELQTAKTEHASELALLRAQLGAAEASVETTGQEKDDLKAKTEEQAAELSAFTTTLGGAEKISEAITDLTRQRESREQDYQQLKQKYDREIKVKEEQLQSLTTEHQEEILRLNKSHGYDLRSEQASHSIIQSQTGIESFHIEEENKILRSKLAEATAAAESAAGHLQSGEQLKTQLTAVKAQLAAVQSELASRPKGDDTEKQEQIDRLQAELAGVQAKLASKEDENTDLKEDIKQQHLVSDLLSMSLSNIQDPSLGGPSEDDSAAENAKLRLAIENLEEQVKQAKYLHPIAEESESDIKEEEEGFRRGGEADKKGRSEIDSDQFKAMSAEINELKRALEAQVKEADQAEQAAGAKIDKQLIQRIKGALGEKGKMQNLFTNWETSEHLQKQFGHLVKQGNFDSFITAVLKDITNSKHHIRDDILKVILGVQNEQLTAVRGFQKRILEGRSAERALTESQDRTIKSMRTKIKKLEDDIRKLREPKVALQSRGAGSQAHPPLGKQSAPKKTPARLHGPGAGDAEKP